MLAQIIITKKNKNYKNIIYIKKKLKITRGNLPPFGSLCSGVGCVKY